MTIESSTQEDKGVGELGGGGWWGLQKEEIAFKVEKTCSDLRC